MHSSRMRTGRSLTVCWRLLPGGGCLVKGGVWSGGCLLWGVSGLGGVSAPGGCGLGGVSGPGVSAPGGYLVRGVCSGGGVASQYALRADPPLWTESQTPVKALPWPNFVAAGN